MNRVKRDCVRPRQNGKETGGKVHFVNLEKWKTECGLDVKKAWVVYPSDMSRTTLYRIGCQRCLIAKPIQK